MYNVYKKHKQKIYLQIFQSIFDYIKKFFHPKFHYTNYYKLSYNFVAEICVKIYLCDQKTNNSNFA